MHLFNKNQYISIQDLKICSVINDDTQISHINLEWDWLKFEVYEKVISHAVAIKLSNLNRKTVQKNRIMYRLYRSKERMLRQSTAVSTVKIDKQIGKAVYWFIGFCGWIETVSVLYY